MADLPAQPAQPAQPTKTWIEAFKDPKVLAVLIPLVIGGLGSTFVVIKNMGKMEAKVEHLSQQTKKQTADIAAHKSQMESMHEIITNLAKNCGGS
jgi:flagellar basal body-associated protein FliL